ncbi:helix-turn-helix transcriptional regulator [Asticcacaulis sp. AC402]|uniref:helix-turn-helix transcriptional regulator n=1 Tax=Asticcacaulis sp. AC402 TaxID=1282361 RepID=UPI0003C3ABFF|nr:helix-turn-helix transcriptional regulator [Asticcacaulis sp. AC402]ESQ73751.1 hypothetical protein ABAC402_17565 [Asticcacaulis sp. AC402]
MRIGPTKLIDLMYDAAFDDDAFARLPAAFAELVGGRSATIQFFDQDWTHIDFAGSYFGPEMYAKYAQHHYKDDIWINAGLAQTRGKFRSMDEIVSLDQFLKTSTYNEFFRSNGDDTMHCIATNLASDSGAIIIGIHRAHTPGAFEEDEALLLQQTVPHIRRLHLIRARLRDADMRSNMANAALDCFAFAVMVVKSDRQIVSTNAAADKILRQGDGLVSLRGKVSAKASDVDRALGHGLFNATLGRPARTGVVQLHCPNGGASRKIIVSVMPDRKQALIIVEPPNDYNAVGAHLAQFYGLSAAEIGLAETLLKGGQLEDYAIARDVRLSTVRTQLSSLLRKTDTHRQSQLIAMLARLPSIKDEKS